MNKLDPARLDEVFPRALEHPEIKPHVDQTISRGALQRAVREATASIWDAAGEALNAEEAARDAEVKAKESVQAVFDGTLHSLIEGADLPPEQIALALADMKLDHKNDLAAHTIKPLLPPKGSFRSSRIVNLVLGVFSSSLSLVAVGTAVALVVYLVTGRGWSGFIASSWVPVAGQTAVLLLIGTALFGGISAALESRAKRRAREPTERLLEAVSRALDLLAASSSAAKNTVESAKARADTDLLTAMVRVLRRAVDAAQADDYSTVLPDIIPRGLAEGYNIRSDLITPARARLERYLESMPNGSIGIAGSRGAGKSTLLHTFAAKQSIKRKKENGDIDELGVFSVEVSAPVQYDARDFVLHIFSSMCVSVRKRFGDREEDRPTADAAPDAAKEWKPLANKIAFTLMRYTAAIGIVLFTVAVMSGISIAIAKDVKVNAFANMGIKPVDLALQSLTWLAATLLLSLVHRHTQQQAPPLRIHLSEEGEIAPETQKPVNAILDVARENALVIRYQRSYAADWNIGASFAGISAGVKQGQSLQEQRLTLPEIVARYREFVTLLAEREVVIVAIDELDKIADDIKAQQFLNDIKALFGIPNCFYLITVSDNAMSSFARRGLPIRDAFDSALDEIVRVEHMDLPDAQKLLAGRVIGFPIPYLAFCYCYSAGLPRDLIRSCRDVFEVADRPGRKEPRELALIAHEIFCEDLASKVKGSITAISAQKKGAFATAVLDRLRLLQDQAEKKLVFLDDYTELEALAAITTDVDVRALTTDLASYLYYALTVLDVISAHQNDAKRWEASRLRRLFEDLAALRRYIGVESGAAGGAITRLRVSEKLVTPPPPAPPAV